MRVATSVNHAMKVPSSGRSATVNVGDVAESVDELGEGEARGGATQGDTESLRAPFWVLLYERARPAWRRRRVSVAQARN